MKPEIEVKDELLEAIEGIEKPTESKTCCPKFQDKLKSCFKEKSRADILKEKEGEIVRKPLRRVGLTPQQRRKRAQQLWAKVRAFVRSGSFVKGMR